MKAHRLSFVCAIGAALALTVHAMEPTATAVPAAKESNVTNRASGSFDVKMSPQGTPDKAAGSALGRMSLDKQYHGDLEATGKGEMLTAMADTEGSGVYVAVERVSGTLQGRHGSFALVHKGTMTRGAPELTINVVPDSGSGDLAGIAGRMKIDIVDGKHFYEFDYTIADAK